jgi:hypothetical protein
MDIEDKIKETTQAIKEEDVYRYSYEPIPCDTDNKIGSLVILFINASPPERSIFFRLVSSPFSGPLLTFAERMASLGVTERSPERIRAGLFALILEDNRGGDYRDNVIRFVPLYHAAGKIGVNPDELFSEVASSESNEIAKYIREFTEGSSYAKSLDASLYKEADGSNGVRYVRHGFV